MRIKKAWGSPASLLCTWPGDSIEGPSQVSSWTATSVRAGAYVLDGSVTLVNQDSDDGANVSRRELGPGVRERCLGSSRTGVKVSQAFGLRHSRKQKQKAENTLKSWLNFSFLNCGIQV